MCKYLIHISAPVYLLLCSEHINAQNSVLEINSDTTLLKYINKQLPKDTARSKVYILKFYSESFPIAKFKIAKYDKRKILIDTFFYFRPYNKDSLFSNSNIKRVDIIGSDSFSADTPIIKSNLIIPSINLNQTLRKTMLDSVEKIKNLLNSNSFHVTYTNEIEYGNNFYYGLTNPNNPRILNQIFVEGNLMGIPMNIGTNYSNFRTDNSLNLSDIHFNLDLMKLKNEYTSKNLLSSQQLENLNSKKKFSEFEMNQLDSEINVLQSKVNNKYELDKYNGDVNLIKDINKDTSYKNRIDKGKIKQAEYNSRLHKEDQTRLQKLIDLREIKNKSIKEINYEIISEKNLLLKGRNFRNNLAKSSKISSNLSWIYTINKFDFGRIAPIYSNLTLNGLTYLGLNTEFNINKLELSFTGGRLNNYSSYLGNINNDLGGYIYGGRLKQNLINSNRFLSVLYYNPIATSKTELKSDRYIVIGLGGNNQIYNNLSFDWELAYAETDSSNRYNLGENKLFQKFNPYAIAANIVLKGNIDSKTQFELISRYTGFDFKNPASFNLRNDFLRNSLKVSRSFPKRKLQITYQLKYDVDNFTKLKLASTSIWNNNLLFNFRLSKTYKLIINLNHTKLNNQIENQTNSTIYQFINSLANINIINSYSTKKIISTSTLNYNIIRSESYNFNSLLQQGSISNTLQHIQSKINLNSILGCQMSNTDTSFGMNLSAILSRSFGRVELSIGTNYKQLQTNYSYQSINTGISYQAKKLFKMSITAEYYRLHDSFSFTNNRGNIDTYFIKTQMFFRL